MSDLWIGIILGLFIYSTFVTLVAALTEDEDSIIVFEANKDTDISYIDSYGFEIFKIKEYKNNMHVFLRRK